MHYSYHILETRLTVQNKVIVAGHYIIKAYPSNFYNQESLWLHDKAYMMIGI